MNIIMYVQQAAPICEMKSLSTQWNSILGMQMTHSSQKLTIYNKKSLAADGYVQIIDLR